MNKLKKMVIGATSSNFYVVDIYLSRNKDAIDYFLMAIKSLNGYRQMDSLVASKQKLKKMYKEAVYVEGQEGVDYLKFTVTFELYTEADRSNLLSQLEIWKNDSWILDYEVVQE